MKCVFQVDDARETVTTSMNIITEWRDPLLKWNPADYGSILVLENSELCDRIWKPSILVINGWPVRNILEHVDDMKIQYNGKVTALVSLILETRCELNLLHYPYDKQKCRLAFFSHNIGVDLNFTAASQKWDSVYTLLGTKAGNDWRLNAVKFSSRSDSGSLENLNAVASPGFHSLVLEMSRKTVFYTLSLVFPLLLTSYMNCLALLLPPTSGEQVACMTHRALHLHPGRRMLIKGLLHTLLRK